MLKRVWVFEAKGGRWEEGVKGYQLRESTAFYEVLFEVKNEDIGLENIIFWDVYAE